ncbi:hypothetical protein H0E87_026990 [Populus deltoides]|uniref:Uncharacterized protein n=1 Tax=Populus deltoides TaxID=3696 RepID=A0A8T2WWT2_POPDE|nr:hypothetical protein H0E87_026990 [Populus deltoides]
MTGVKVEGVEARISGHMEMILRNSCGVKFMEVSKSMMDLMFDKEAERMNGRWLFIKENMSRPSESRLRRERSGVRFGGKSGKMEGSWARKCGAIIMVG